MAQDPELAPVYRYFTADLLTNEILSEIPFRGVSYERAVKGAGAFSGKIPVIPDTRNLNLYESTMPGNTALYVVRNGVCVWGGVIWARSHSVKDRNLDVSASEFTSFFYHRRVWKTWNHQFEAQITVGTSNTVVNLVNGSSSALKAGASVQLEFFEPGNYGYNGHYVVSGTPAPTVDKFTVVSPSRSVAILGAELTSNKALITTVEPHGLTSGDTVTIAGAGSIYNGSYAVEVVNGVAPNQFYYTRTNANVAYAATSGTASKRIPNGTYSSVTVTVRTDTYDYVRSLIDGVFSDFMGIDFPNVYIEPGMSYPNEVVARKSGYGKAEITTRDPHNLSIGQGVQVKNLGTSINGEHEVLDTPDAYTFTYKNNSTWPYAAVARRTRVIDSRGVNHGIVTMTTTADHNFRVGETATIVSGNDPAASNPIYNGSFKIDTIPAARTFTYKVSTALVESPTALTDATATGPGGTRRLIRGGMSAGTGQMTLVTDGPHGFSVGQSITVTGANPATLIAEKSYEAATKIAKITTVEPHYLVNAQNARIDGLKDYADPVSITVTGGANPRTVSITTASSNNFAVGDEVVISDLVDTYRVLRKEATGGTAKVTFDRNSNLAVGNIMRLDGIYDKNNISTKSLTDNIATLTFSSGHVYAVNDEITVENITDTMTVTSKAVENNIAVLNTLDAHNFFESDEVTIAGLGAPFDGKFTVLGRTDYEVLYDLDSDVVGKIPYVAPTKANGTVSSDNSIFQGTYLVSDVPNSTSVSYLRAANPVSARAASGTVTGTTAVWNGAKTITAVTNAVVSFAAAGTVPIVDVPLPPVADDGKEQLPPPTAKAPHLINGTATITATTRNTLAFTTSVLGKDATTQPLNAGMLSVNSYLNGDRAVTVTSPTTFTFSMSGSANVGKLRNNMLEVRALSPAYSYNIGTYNGIKVVSAVPDPSTFTTTLAQPRDQPERDFPRRGVAEVVSTATSSTFGPYPGNADIGMEFSTRRYSGTNIVPTLYRGFELVNVGEALDQYSDNIDGFEYRVDCIFDEANNVFRKVFMLLPINFPNPPAPGEVSPLARFGADRIVFEYPGNIIELTIDETAENSATRFFAVGENDLGPDAGPPFSVASATDLLSGVTEGGIKRRWPLLDEDAQVKDVDDEAVLYAYARRYLTENRPPDAKLTVSVNGSLQPVVGSYAPGDWCSLIVDDEFIQMRLASGLEPRETVLVRKIDAMKVTVPDGITFPEKVDLTLVPEWEVDKRG